MIPMPEEYIAELLIERIDFLRKNIGYIDRILKMSQQKRETLKTFLLKNKISVLKAYPRTPSELPCVCILLSKEETSQIGVGDMNIDEDYNIQSRIDGELRVISTDRDKYGFPYVQLQDVAIEEVIYVKNITLNGEDGEPLQEGVEYDIFDSDRGVIILYGGMVENNDLIEISYTYRQTSLEEMEILSNANYRLECWTNNGDLTVNLYHIVKWAMMSGRDWLIQEYDLFNQKIGGGDFEPVPSYFPEFVYRRAISFWCEYKSSIPKDEIPYIKEVYVNQPTLSLGGEING